MRKSDKGNKSKEKIMKKSKAIRPKTQPHGKNVKFGKKLTNTTII